MSRSAAHTSSQREPLSSNFNDSRDNLPETALASIQLSAHTRFAQNLAIGQREAVTFQA